MYLHKIVAYNGIITYAVMKHDLYTAYISCIIELLFEEE